jgi:hypothetical protein
VQQKGVIIGKSGAENGRRSRGEVGAFLDLRIEMRDTPRKTEADPSAPLKNASLGMTHDFLIVQDDMFDCSG